MNTAIRKIQLKKWLMTARVEGQIRKLHDHERAEKGTHINFCLRQAKTVDHVDFRHYLNTQSSFTSQSHKDHATAVSYLIASKLPPERALR
ncbi:unnamed protein product [Dovyalis caffra]|uniref:Uncharacterized protein n=1 Tax=Dovyalis caffra TaxID=77055 RepID=A0AAV1RWB1_9ROSI|nr:unnamed protein product [Dovyalis caffra]